MSAPTVADVVAVLEDLYPPSTAEGWDAVGLVAGDPDREVRKVLLAVDPVAAVVDEALDWGADLVVAHHPLFLKGVHSVAATTFKGSVVHRLLTAGCGRSNEGPAPFADRAHLVFFLHDAVVVHAPAALAEDVAREVREAAVEAGRLLFGDFPVSFPLTVTAVDAYADAK